MFKQFFQLKEKKRYIAVIIIDITTEKEKTTSVNKHVDEHNTTRIAQMGIRDRSSSTCLLTDVVFSFSFESLWFPARRYDISGTLLVSLVGLCISWCHNIPYRTGKSLILKLSAFLKRIHSCDRDHKFKIAITNLKRNHSYLKYQNRWSDWEFCSVSGLDSGQNFGISTSLILGTVMLAYNKVFDSDCTAVLFNVTESSKASLETVKFLNVSDSATSSLVKILFK